MRPPLSVSATAAGLSKSRRWFFGLMALEFALFVAVGLVWLFVLYPRVHVWWLLLPLLPAHFAFARLAKRKVVCPNCEVSLIDHDGVAIFAKACDHCGHRFR
jgi:hypothetical protein